MNEFNTHHFEPNKQTMIKLLQQWMLLFFIPLTFLFSCDEDPVVTPPVVTAPIEVDTDLYKVTDVNVNDIGNAENGSDIAVRLFTSDMRSAITDYSVVVIKESSSFESSNVNTLGSNQIFTLETSDRNKALRLNAELNDTDGDEIKNNVSYKIGVISNFTVENNDYNALNISSTFTLVPISESVSSIPTIFKDKDGLDGITVDKLGNVYVSNYGVFENGAGSGSEVYKITPYGELTRFASGLTVPGGIVADDLGNIFVANGVNIHKITKEGQKSIYATHNDGFAGLIIDQDGNIFSGGFAHTKILKITPDGTVVTLADDPMLDGTVGLAYHEETSTLYAGNFNNGWILKITMDGTVSQLVMASGIGYLTEMNDNLYATLFGVNQIARIGLDGKITIIVGKIFAQQEDGAFDAASFNQPNGIIGDAANNVLYVSDWGNPRITKIQLID